MHTKSQCVCVFYMILRTERKYFPLQSLLVRYYNRDGECLLCGTG